MWMLVGWVRRSEAGGAEALGRGGGQVGRGGGEAVCRQGVPGAEGVGGGGEVIGVARDLAGPAGAELLVVEARGKEHLVPFRAPIVRRLDRAARRIEVDLPPGLLEL